jgi:hypothetical protein
MARRSRSNSYGSSGGSSRRPQWLVIATGIATLLNTLMRLFKLFGGGKRSASSRADAPPVGPPPTRRESRDRYEEPAPPRTSAPPPRDQRDDRAPRGNQPGRGVAVPSGPPEPVGTDGGIGTLYKRRQSDVIVTASGTVVKILPDDDDDSDGSGKHQKFLVDLVSGVTIRISHNITLGQRAPVREGDVVHFKGEYEYTDLGGCVHWTHHDPKGWREGGWIEVNGARYE